MFFIIWAHLKPRIFEIKYLAHEVVSVYEFEEITFIELTNKEHFHNFRGELSHK